MIIHKLQKKPPPKLCQSLCRFEEQFLYPLGTKQFFRIVHDDDYPRFFRAMGEGICFVAERDERILGVMGAALRCLALPEGGNRKVVYLGDVKIEPAARGGRTLFRLAGAVQQWVGTRTDAAIAVVMDGTSTLPSRYTGRLGIPLFSELGKISVLGLPTSEIQEPFDPAWLTNSEHGSACYLHLSAGRYACLGGNPSARSEMKPVWIMEPNDRACGRLEDTRRAKRLIADDGTEMQSAHLSCFAYQDPDAGLLLLQNALRQAAKRSFTHLFAAVPDRDARALSKALEPMKAVIAPATVFGTQLEPRALWNINTAEI